VLRQARVFGRIRTPVLDASNRLTVRLQGIDAPDLHYRPSPLPRTGIAPEQRQAYRPFDRSYRQHFAETATRNLAELLQRDGKPELPCRVTTAVESPQEVFDTNGRLVGHIIVTLRKRKVNVNHWLVRSGWAFPSFYSSLAVEELQALLTATRVGRRKKAGIWSSLQQAIGTLDRGLLFRRKTPVPSEPDTGPLLNPKLFRRLCSWTALRGAGIFPGDFRSYLLQGHESLFLTTEFLRDGIHAAPLHFMADFLQPDGTFSLAPEEIIFREAPSKLVGPDGKKITVWW
jgi:endonuclease YncB( thermonuclease family)